MCKSLVNLMGGIISCNSRLGEGTTFSFWIPLLDTETDYDLTIRSLSDAHIMSREDSNPFDVLNSPDVDYSRKLTSLRQLSNISSSSGFNFSSYNVFPSVIYIYIYIISVYIGTG